MLADVIDPQKTRQPVPSTDAARCIGLLAVRSLHTELRLHPKPGLVTPIDNGSHHDMNATTFLRSLFALRHYFVSIAQAGSDAAPFEVLRELGIAAECAMMRATGGINTHRGAIFAVGMMAAAIGAAGGVGAAVAAGAAGEVGAKKVIDPGTIRHALLQHWGAALKRHAHKIHYDGAMPAHGARAEAANGFTSVFMLGLPTLRRALTQQRSWHHACIDTLFMLIAQIDDTNIVHRGGSVGAAQARALAQQFITAGATANPQWERHASHISSRFVTLNLSPGGAADLLAATCLVHWATAPHGTLA